MPISKVGVISDTHGRLRAEAIEQLRGSELIIHAGDVGDPDILVQLESIAPLTAIKGNIDTAKPLSNLPSTAIAEAGSSLIYVLHNLQELDLDPKAAQFDIVVFGHSHKPGLWNKSGVLYLNPGSAGPRRFKLPVTLARLDFTASPPGMEFVDLLTGSILPMALGTDPQPA